MTDSNHIQYPGSDADQKIWGLANRRFLQCEASFWVLKVKTLELVALLTVVVWVYLEFFSDGKFTTVKNASVVLFLIVALITNRRASQYSGYFDGRDIS